MSTELVANLDALYDQLQTEIGEDIKQRELIDVRLEKNKALLAHIRGSRNAYKLKSESPNTEEYILEALGGMTVGETFAVNDLTDQILSLHPDSQVNARTVNNQLYRMIKRGKAKTFRQITKGGAGRSPARYERVAGPTKIRLRTRGSGTPAATNGSESH